MRVQHTVQVYESIVHSIRKAHSAERKARCGAEQLAGGSWPRGVAPCGAVHPMLHRATPQGGQRAVR